MDSLFRLLDQATGTRRQLRRGDVLFHENNRGDSFYLVRNGRLRAIRNLDGENPVTVGEVGRGEIIGEMAVLSDAPRSASVIAIRDTHLTEYSGSDLAALPKESLLAVMRILATRIRKLMDGERDRALPNCIAVVPVQQGLPIEEYCERLVGSLKEDGGRCLWMRDRDLPSEFKGLANCDGEDFERLGQWLEEKERSEAMLLLQADYEVTPWTERCLRQADLILLLAQPIGEPVKSPAERAIERLPGKQARPRVDMVLLQNEAPYRNTAAWLANRQITRHHHVRLSDPVDKARAGRMLTGKDVSFTFGGGGARGFAHIGILRACQELGIPVDRVCGTSMGSIVSGLAAMGHNWEEITDRLRIHWTQKRKLVDYTFPLLSIDTSRGYARALQQLFGETRIEDLPINYFCVSCNLTQADVMIHREGPMAKWIGASISVPGIAPPLVENGELLVDGGLLNNLPVDIAKADGAGMVVGVDVSPETEFRLPASYSGRPQALDVFWSRISGRKKDQASAMAKPVFPTLAGILYRATSLSSVFQQDQLIRRADFYIKVNVDQFRLLEFESLDAISKIGHTTGLEKLAPVSEWVKKNRQPKSIEP
ncbi:MAG: patatin-like phospholipase family protein [Verrucomicrobiales bacterium]